MNAESFADALISAQIDSVVYLPDSWLAGTIKIISAREDLLSIPVSREEEGIALGCGLVLGGRRPVVLMQNAGLLSFRERA